MTRNHPGECPRESLYELRHIGLIEPAHLLAEFESKYPLRDADRDKGIRAAAILLRQLGWRADGQGLSRLSRSLIAMCIPSSGSTLTRQEYDAAESQSERKVLAVLFVGDRIRAALPPRSWQNRFPRQSVSMNVNDGNGARIPAHRDRCGGCAGAPSADSRNRRPPSPMYLATNRPAFSIATQQGLLLPIIRRKSSGRSAVALLTIDAATARQ
ncbi:hypothetical protein ACVWWG_009289 [Bradyrhizobium sp. LB7.2]